MDATALAADDYWTAPMLRSLVRIEEGTSMPLAGVSACAAKAGWRNSFEYSM